MTTRSFAANSDTKDFFWGEGVITYKPLNFTFDMTCAFEDFVLNGIRFNKQDKDPKTPLVMSSEAWSYTFTWDAEQKLWWENQTGDEEPTDQSSPTPAAFSGWKLGRAYRTYRAIFG